MIKRLPEGRGVQSIEVGGRLLAAMVELGKPAMLRDLAAMAKVTSAQAHAYLVSFRKIGLVDQDAASGRYLLGPFALQLGLTRMREHVPLRMASQAAVELAAETGLMVTVTVWGSHGPTIIDVEESVRPVHVNLRVGAGYTVTGTATGRLFAAFLPEEIVGPLIEKELDAGRSGPARQQRERMAADFDEIRRRGFATTEGIPVPGINAVSAPVLDHSGQVQFAITLIGPAADLIVKGDSEQALFVRRFAENLSANLGFRPERPGDDAAAPILPFGFGRMRADLVERALPFARPTRRSR
ncbi:IclR family transcriptional regulator [Phreatobacter sp. AB_2022a]|uniref:IclR family transcriptional regulator n=1 Tax=Phreatobacter sp. AB_2022a TaxID=3003134 RepID=UPI002287239B|nr:IclR family transcriptional regulator [Phreatobacter sp. AB_2022a]MCZ0733843.1 IclR family transcriptional regulator [Phreatobacter sp. AB_2022a]